jgi:hypothetical protein
MRDLFAAFALAGILANKHNSIPSLSALDAYIYADEMIKRRNEYVTQL